MTLNERQMVDRMRELCGLKPINEYNFSTGIREDDQQDAAMGADPNAVAGAPDPNAMMGADPNAAAGAPDPNAMMGADPNAAAGASDPNAMIGADPNATMDGMDMGGGANPEVGPDDQVVDIDQLTKAQEAAEYKIDDVSDKLNKLISVVDKFVGAIDDTDAKIAELKSEIERRNPTDEERAANRIKKSSAPYSDGMSPKDDPDRVKNDDDDTEYEFTINDAVNTNDYQAVKSITEYPRSFIDYFK